MLVLGRDLADYASEFFKAAMIDVVRYEQKYVKSFFIFGIYF